MTRIMNLLLLCIFIICIVSCDVNTSNGDTSRIVLSDKEGLPLFISVEVLSNMSVDKNSIFEIKVGLGKKYLQSDEAKLKIDAKDFIIYSSDGEQCNDCYIKKYNDFNDSKYEFIENETFNDSVITLQYFENYRFKYIGSETNKKVYIQFDIIIYEDNVPEDRLNNYIHYGEGTWSSSVYKSCKIHDDKIDF